MKEEKPEELMKLKKISQWETFYPTKYEKFGSLGSILSIRNEENYN